MLDEASKTFYREALAKGDGAAALGFELPESQEVRFQLVHDRLLEEEWKEEEWGVGHKRLSLLDVGCGTGDLYTFLAERSVMMLGDQYVGVDLMPEMIDRARVRFPDVEDHRRWEVGDVRQMVLPEVDYVACVATFCLKPEEKDQAWCMNELVSTMERLVKVCRKAMLVTCLSTWKTNILPNEFVVDATAAWWAARGLCDRVDLIHSYAPHDFALLLDFRKSRWMEAWEAKHGAE